MASEERLKKIARILKQRHKNIVVVLEDIHDPHNASAVFRTCDAFGIQDVYLIFDKEKPFDPKEIGKSTSSSANKWLTFHNYSNANDCLKELKQNGFTTFVTALSQNSVDLANVDFAKKEKIALVFGNEHSGVSQEMLANADTIVSIPMQGFVQSLNLSVTAAIFIYEATKQRLSR